jgi:16S rRNA processing protein RimM
MSSTPTAELLVGVVLRPHGLRGELVVEVHTDSPEERFAPGAKLTARSAGGARIDPARSAGGARIDPARSAGGARIDPARSAGGAGIDPARSAGGASGEPAGGAGALTVESSRPHSGRLLVRFAEVADRDAAEVLRGARLVIATDALAPLADPDEFHVHQLEGLRAELPDGAVAGVVREVVHGPGGELLVVARPDLPDALVPFVREIVPTVDLAAGRVVLTPPEGLLDLA